MVWSHNINGHIQFLLNQSSNEIEHRQPPPSLENPAYIDKQQLLYGAMATILCIKPEIEANTSAVDVCDQKWKIVLRAVFEVLTSLDGQILAESSTLFDLSSRVPPAQWRLNQLVKSKRDMTKPLRSAKSANSGVGSSRSYFEASALPHKVALLAKLLPLRLINFDLIDTSHSIGSR